MEDGRNFRLFNSNKRWHILDCNKAAWENDSLISHLEDAMCALSVKLTPEEIAYLEEQYVPHEIVGHN